jgi:hypothetical protein
LRRIYFLLFFLKKTFILAYTRKPCLFIFLLASAIKQNEFTQASRSSVRKLRPKLYLTTGITANSQSCIFPHKYLKSSKFHKKFTNIHFWHMYNKHFLQLVLNRHQISGTKLSLFCEEDSCIQRLARKTHRDFKHKLWGREGE